MTIPWRDSCCSAAWSRRPTGWGAEDSRLRPSAWRTSWLGVPPRALAVCGPSYRPGVTPANLWECLPRFIGEDLKLGIVQMDRQLRGFALPDAVLTGVETRSSSPVRLSRDALRMGNLAGLYPVGEGAGYAGGIVSAAVDGIDSALAALERSTL